jgi:uncharacterized protein (TIGR02147 family)
MPQRNLFEFSSYKPYLRSLAGGKNARRGLKTEMARALACQPTYVSQVLNDHAHFSLEQAAALNRFLAHDREEGHFFLLLVQKDRAGTEELRFHFQELLQEILDRRMNLERKLGKQNILSADHQTTFYSSWHFAAISLAVTVPSLQSKEAIAEYFHLPLAKVSQVLSFLVDCGLVARTGNRFSAGSSVLRIGRDSPHLSKHHANWRTQALESLDREELHDLHYSAAITLSRADVRMIKEKIMEHIQANIGLIRESKEEEVYAYCVDFFRLKR